MSFNQDEYNLLISDKRTVMSFSNNDARNGRIIVMDAIIRPVLHSSNKEDYTIYACETKCGVSICADTYMRFVSNQRVAKVDILSTTGDSMARATETKPTLIFGGATPEASPPPVVKTLVFGGTSQSTGHKTKEA